MAVTHQFVSSVVDEGDPDKVGPVEWNQTHAVTFVGARVYRSVVQTLTTSTTTPIGFDSEDFDSDSFHDNATNNTRLTVPLAGKYRVSSTVTFASNGTGGRAVYIFKNGVAVSANAFTQPSATNSTTLLVEDVLSAVATDYFEIRAFQSSGGDLDVAAGTLYTRASIEYLGA